MVSFNNINKVSWFEFKINPNPLKPVPADTSSILIQFPDLPTTVPKAYILPYTGVNCVYAEKYVQKCYSYPEVNMIVCKLDVTDLLQY